MARIGFVYFSGTDSTAKLVEEAARVVANDGHDVLCYQIHGAKIIEGRFVDSEIFDELNTCQVIVFASPTYMGGPSAQFKAFADATSDFWSDQPWSGKIAAGITSGSAPNGDQSSTIHYFQTLATQHGMLWVGLDVAHCNLQPAINRLGHQGGVVAHCVDGQLSQLDVNSAISLATRISKLV
ncbi:flavodoxin family protein [Aliiglaciecola sp. M165]|uniref:flavodoxin family protein n=1 Tax=Aliiglaciecola sp. M165 TaxID=2593649 RepID=UPI00117C0810|nr:flavodoxin family protein [Aliiglaciecola sp. M165]TRY30675.1 flavodoxin family protein [Aliiglaciecola sp. M165]